MARPPEGPGADSRIIRWLIRVLPPERVNDVLGDLREAQHRTASDSTFQPLRWRFRQAAAFGFWLTLEWIRNVPRRWRQREALMNGLWKDLQFAIRVAIRNPAFSLIAVGTLALGIGSTTAIFTVVNAVLWQPLNFPGSEKVVGVCQRSPGEPTGFCGASPPNSNDWERLSGTLNDFGVARNRSLLFRGPTGTEIVNGAIATPGFLRSLGLRPHLGRLFDEGDLPPNQHRVMVLTYDYWITQFGADSSLVGRSVSYDDESYEIVGVLSPQVEPAMLDWAKVWRPIPWSPDDETNRGWSGFYSIARLRDGATLEGAQSEMEGIAARLEEAHPVANENVSVQLLPLKQQLTRSVRSQLLIFLGAAVLVLLIAAVNVANLLLARAADRQKEFAVRSSLGAGVTRVMRQLLTESTVLCAAALIAGVALGHLVMQWLVALAPRGIPRLEEVSTGAEVLGLGVFLLLVTAFVFGLAPGWRAASVDLAEAMKQGGRWQGRTGSVGVRRALVVVEVALAVTLLIGAGLLLRSFNTAARWDPGFDAQNVGTIWMLASTTKYTESAQLPSLYDEVVESVEAIPGILSAGTASAGPLFGGEETGRFTIVGRPDPAAGERPRFRWFDVGPRYFPTLGRRVLRGRGLEETDTRGTPLVAVVNEAAVRRYFPSENPLGQRLVDREPWDGNEVTMEIVGVVSDVAPYDPNSEPEPEVYWSNRQRTRWATYLVYRSERDPRQYRETIKGRTAEVDPTMSLGSVSTFEELMRGRLIRPRFRMMLIGAFALVAVSLALVGIYGVISYGVSSRTQEFGVRMSLGAAGQDILRLVLREGALLGMIGIGAGLLGAAALTHLLRSMLVGVSPRDLTTFIVVTILLAGVVLLASYWPARRASQVDPMEAMRAE